MRYEHNMLVATADELAGAAQSLGLSHGPLSTTLFDIRGAEQVRAFEDGLVRLDDSQRDVFEVALPIACDPVRSAMLRSGSDGVAGAQFLAWDADGTTVSIEQADGELALRTVEATQLKVEILAALRSASPFGGSDVRMQLEARDAFALVAMADARRRKQLDALLTHAPAADSLTATEVAAAIADAAADDPRWISCLFEKIIPTALREVMDGPTTDLALGRLVTAGVIDLAETDSDASALYLPTTDGAAVLDGLAHAFGAVAITIYGMTEAGPTYESMLLARAPATVWTVLLSPADSFVASASASGLVALVDAALAIAD